MTKHQKVKICQDLYRNETENYKHEQLGIIIYLVLFVILFVLILVYCCISSEDKTLPLAAIGFSFVGICECVLYIVSNHNRHVLIRDCINEHDFVITKHDGKIQLKIPDTDIVLSDE